MNAKQTAPLLATLAPALVTAAPILLIGGAVFLVLNCLLSDDARKRNRKPRQRTPKRNAAGKRRKPPVFRPIPAEIPVKPAAVPVPSAPRVRCLRLPFRLCRKFPRPRLVPAAIAIPKIATQVPPPPIKKKFVTREDIAAVFHHGARPLTRTAAVAALKSLGFGKSAAYDGINSGRTLCRLAAIRAGWNNYLDGIIQNRQREADNCEFPGISGLNAAGFFRRKLPE